MCDYKNKLESLLVKMPTIQYIHEDAGVWIRNLFYGPAQGLYVRRYY